VAGRILAAELLYEPSVHRADNETTPGKRVWPRSRPLPMPTFSSNDRSRWVTIRALVEQGTYVVGHRNRTLVFASAVSLLGARSGPEAALLTVTGYNFRIKSDTGLVTEEGWQTVDKVLHPSKMEFFSSKPPLFSTLVAGLYWILYHLGWTFADHPATVVRVIVLLVNGVPFLVYLALLARLLERYGGSDWGRFYVFAAACFATLVTTFVITLNNHSVGTYTAVFALYPALRIWESTVRAIPAQAKGSGDGTPSTDGEQAGRSRSVSGGEHGQAPPAWQFLLAGFFAAFTACNELPATAFAVFLGVWLLLRAPARTLAYFVPAAAVPVAAFFLTNYLAIGQFRPAYDEFGSVWYEYEGSHWRKPVEGEQKTGIDWARFKETRAEYAFHVLLGHHGLFTLSPIWLLAVAGMLAVLAPGRSGATTPGGRPAETPGPRGTSSLLQSFLFPESALTLVRLLTLLLTVVVVGFYLLKSDNYGGWTSGLRWLMWLSPFWLLTMLPVADRLGTTRAGRALAYVLLAVSVLSVSYAAWNPWRHPWLFNFMQDQGWVAY
jgi:hypothetical protein